MANKRNAAAGLSRDGIECRFNSDVSVPTPSTAARHLQLIRASIPILSAHIGLDGLAQIGGTQ